MNFFERQDEARLKTERLVPLVAAAIAGVTVAIYLLALVLWQIGLFLYNFLTGIGAPVQMANTKGPMLYVSLWTPWLMATALVATVGLIVGGSLWKSRQIARIGGRGVALRLGGRLLNPATTNLNERRLMNVVEEMAIASGTAVPEIYILEHETTINALVAGLTPQDAIVAATDGALRYLGRDELQGVIAHEYSHIFNGDMRLNMRLIGIVHGLFCITLLSDWLMATTYRQEDQFRSGSKTVTQHPVRDLAILAVGFVLAFIGFAGALAARVIKSGIARQREYLADAAAVQYTRYPEGLAGALKKVEAWDKDRGIQSFHAEEASHLFFTNAMNDESRLTATHPPTGERIRRIESMIGTNFAAGPRPGPVAAADEESPF